ncbi:MAG: hypothetical protein AAB558_03250 [Patescibacteria group bacterium]
MSLNGTLERVGQALRRLGIESPDPDREQVKFLVAELLNIIPQGTYGTKLFNALARLTVTTAVEACCFRQTETGPEVLLRQRGPQETYPGQFHCPGSVYRPGESDADLFARLQRTEAMTDIRNPRLVGHNNHLTEERGHFVALIFLVDAEAGPGTRWYSVMDLPEPILEQHRTKVIPTALEAFHRERT